ncbi:MAG: hypothetical protein AAGD38_17430 [Acidobacteriota bacterium]
MLTTARLLFLAVVGGMLVVTSAHAQLTNLECGDQLYGASDVGELFTLDLNDASAVMVGMLPGTGAAEIEYDILGDTLYLGVGGGERLFEVNPANGAALGVSDHLTGHLDGLEYIGSTLYGTFYNGATTQLVVVDSESGTFFSIGNTRIREPVSGLAFDPHRGILYGITGETGLLLTFDFDNGVATVIADTGLAEVGSIEFGPDGRLYGGLTASAPQHATALVVIDRTTGDFTSIGATGFSIAGLTACRAYGGIAEGVVEVPVLSPAGIAALAVLLLIAGFWVLARRP